MFRKGQCVLAKCQNYPYWPGIIISYKTLDQSYKVTFVGESSYATISANFIIPFTEQAARTILAQGANSANRKLKRSIGIAIRRYKGRDHLLSTEPNSEELLDYELSSQPKPVVIIPLEPPPKIARKEFVAKNKHKTPSEQAGILMEILLQDMVQLEKRELFSEDNGARLKQVMDSTELGLKSLVEEKVLEKMIMVLKTYDSMRVDCGRHRETISFIASKYQRLKQLLTGDFGELELHHMRRENILFKISSFKAYR